MIGSWRTRRYCAGSGAPAEERGLRRYVGVVRAGGRGDARHAAAVRVLRRLGTDRRVLCTTNHVAGETYTLLRVRLGFDAAQEALRRMRESRVVERVFVLDEWEQEAERLLAQYSDQDFSYVDGTSFVAMRRLGLSEVFAFDRHFATAGFQLIVR